MLSKEQINEIREHLERAQNPVFFFDNDCDGLMSFVMLRKFIDRGKGVSVRSSFEESYANKVDEFKADYVFILDKPNVSQGFVDYVTSKGIPIVWIDHHDVPFEFDNNLISYYNPIFNKDKSSEPVSYLVYKVINRKDFQWFSMVGCIADNFVPDFYKDFAKDYPELWKKNFNDAFDVLYCSELGKIINLLDFSLKDRTSKVVSMFSFLLTLKSPYEILKEDDNNKNIHFRYREVNYVYSKLLNKAKKIARNSNKVVFFEYGGDLSLSANIANEISYCFPGKIVIVAYVKGNNANVSVRGEDVRKIALEAFEKIETASGGGHKDAVGAKMLATDLHEFKKYFE